MSGYDSPATTEAFYRLLETGLFTEEELKIAKTWLYESYFGVGMSPNKTGMIVGRTGTYLQQLCKQGKIRANRNMMGWYEIPVDEIIRLKKEAKEKDENRSR